MADIEIFCFHQKLISNRKMVRKYLFLQKIMGITFFKSEFYARFENVKKNQKHFFCIFPLIPS